MRLLALLITLAAVAAAQGQKAPPTNVDRISAQMKNYLRGVTENRFDVRCKITQFDANGKLKKVRNETCRLEFTRGRFKGPGLSADTDWSSEIRITRASRGTLGHQLLTDLHGLVFPAIVFADTTFKVEPSALSGGVVTVAYRSSETCATFETAGSGRFKTAEKNCGAGQVVLDADGTVPLRTSFEAVGLPLAMGKRDLRAYRVEAEFQTANVDGSREPLIVPKSAVATFTFNDYKIVVERGYTLHSGKW